ncbi:hypothetical protein [Paenibacillus roseus]|uniref:Uncharacterized protein n=1 Tax=Paenibacillus roseus TaxID=2798579 RepID=A0A934MND4_9BACL|nr:hypothetical protein [Paenibacillus roseus]MBJ6360896.1 hypothetical protein [Paenibacillus roseus]
MTLESLQAKIADSRIVLSENRTYFATVLEENGDEHELARATTIEDLEQQLSDFGFIK